MPSMVVSKATVKMLIISFISQVYARAQKLSNL